MTKICIIKLGALGDVVRTLPILIALKEKYPQSKITWITKPNANEIVSSSPYVDNIINLGEHIKDSFDILYNFDIDNQATKLAKEIIAKEKKGFFSEGGFPQSFNFSSEDYLNTLFDDETKKFNKKTYQELMFKSAELEYNKSIHPIFLDKFSRDYAKKFIKENGLITKDLIGIHIGASPRWPSKKWHSENLKEFIRKAHKKNYPILLFGGPNEVEEIEAIFNEFKKEGIKIYKNDPNNTIKEFASLVNICKTLICGDTLALHISLSLEKPTIGLFFCTSPNEVEGYGFLRKIVSPLHQEFFPEKMDQYSEELVRSISADQVLSALEETASIPTKVVNAIIKNPEGKFLVIKRSDGLQKGKWAFPGGVVEEGESEEQALRREIKEETNLDLVCIKKKVSEYKYSRKEKSLTEGSCFLVNVENFNVIINKESCDYKWVSLEEFEKLDTIEGLEEELFLAL